MSFTDCSIRIGVSENEYTRDVLAVQGSCLWFLGAFVKQCEQRVVASSCKSVLLVVSVIALKKSAPTGRTFIKFCIAYFHRNLLSLKSERKANTLHKDPPYIYVKISHFTR